MTARTGLSSDPMDAVTEKESASSLRMRSAAGILVLVVLVAGCYFTRLTDVPVVGEEGRRGRGAVEMIETGDWIVVRQQGAVHAMKPPMHYWLIAISGWIRGNVDVTAVRLPSVIAVLLTVLIIRAYARHFLSETGAVVSAAMFATFFQVLELGRMGESDSVFTFFLSGAFFTWHLGYVRHRHPMSYWVPACVLMAFAALTKGPQAPCYFIAATVVYLLLQRDYRTLISGGHLAGMITAATIVAAWLIPYYRMTSWDAVRSTWMADASQRVGLSGLATHMLTYPVEIFCCLLPWSPTLMWLLLSRARQRVILGNSPVTFSVVAVLVAWPTLWLVEGARSRYLMPLYPSIAVVFGCLVERCLLRSDVSGCVWLWKQSQYVAAGAACLMAVVLVAAHAPAIPALHVLQAGPLATLTCIAAAIITTVVLVRTGRRNRTWHDAGGIAAIAAFVAVMHTSLVLNVKSDQWNDLRITIPEIRRQIGMTTRLVSFGPVCHQFGYHYGRAIPRLSWPDSLEDVPESVEFFCFDLHPAAGMATALPDARGTDPETWFPFRWERIAEISCDRVVRPVATDTVVVGRVIRESASTSPEPYATHLTN